MPACKASPPPAAPQHCAAPDVEQRSTRLPPARPGLDPRRARLRSAHGHDSKFCPRLLAGPRLLSEAGPGAHTRGGTRARNLLLRREAPYPLGHTSDVYRLKPLDHPGMVGITAGYMRLLHAHCCLVAGVLSSSEEIPQPCGSRTLRHLIPEIKNDTVIQRASSVSERDSL